MKINHHLHFTQWTISFLTDRKMGLTLVGSLDLHRQDLAHRAEIKQC